MKKHVWHFSLILGALLVFSGISHADPQTDCFNTLKSNVAETDQFFEANQLLEKMNYTDFSSQFSQYYKNMSSFGIDLDEPLIEIRVHSFGRQTGYVHPPYSPFPATTKSDKWGTPAKEFIIAEEYVKSSTGEQIFLSCSLMQISATDLMQVTSEKYLYDGELISALKTSLDQSYKAWYSENMSYDHDRKPFVSWKRLFIYPAATKNSYFDRFTIADSFPAHKVDNFKTAFSMANIMPESEEKVIMYTYSKSGEMINSNAPTALTPVKPTGTNQVFPLNTYYQAIQDTFPQFSQHLALRGVIHYDTLKRMLVTKDNDRFAHIWHTVLFAEDTIRYALKKEKGEIKDPVDFYEKYLKEINDNVMEKNAKQLLVDVIDANDPEMQKIKALEEAIKADKIARGEPIDDGNLATKTDVNEKKIDETGDQKNENDLDKDTKDDDTKDDDNNEEKDDIIPTVSAESNTAIIIIGAVVLLIVIGGVVVFIKKKNDDNE